MCVLVCVCLRINTDPGSAAAPVVRIRRSLARLKQELLQMDVRTGLVQHSLLLSRLKEKSNMTFDLHTTNIT